MHLRMRLLFAARLASLDGNRGRVVRYGARAGRASSFGIDVDQVGETDLPLGYMLTSQPNDGPVVETWTAYAFGWAWMV